VASGDYKLDPDPTCAPFEVVPCDVFITEATFALPIYRWETGEHTAREVLKWWDENIKAGKPSLLFCYALGKSQRVLAELLRLDPSREVYLHGAMTNLTKIYRDAGIEMLPTTTISETDKTKSFAGELILAPPSAYRSVWMKRFKGAETGFASGWMRVRGTRRRKGYDRGFVLSDHADWNELIDTAKQTGASQVLPTHGSTQILTKYLNEIGIEATPLEITAYDDTDSDTGSESETVNA
ncbi:MAG: DNA ligase-associated DEXH box helicase, partial [Bdellovibrionota bacterium]